MNNIALRYVYDRKKTATASNPALLSIEVRQIGTNRTTYVSTGIKLYPHQFSTKNGFTCKNHDKANLVTLKAKGIFNEVESFACSDQCRELKDVRLYNKERPNNRNVVEFIQSELRQNNPTKTILTRHNVLINHLSQYGKIVLFDDLDFEVIDGFDRHLRKTIKSSEGLYKMHSIFRKYIVKAIKLGLCSKNPYDDFKFSKGKAMKDPVFLIEEEMKAIKDYIPINEKMEHVKDLFLFQSYTGLSYTDLMAFKLEWIYEEEGIKVFTDKRKKTDVSFFSVLLPEAETILDKYNGKLPRISNQKYNDYLKVLQVACGIHKHLTTHVARHSYATYLLNKNIPIETVSKALGHTNLKQTQHYAKLLNKKVISDMSTLLKDKK